MTTVIEAMRAVPTPPPVLSREREQRLTDRQQEILEELHEIFQKGFAELTMAELAGELNCSLRTLYALASGRDELVTMVVDRALRRVGRSAHAAVAPDMAAMDAIRAYLVAANRAVRDASQEFATDMEAFAAGVALNDAHNQYLVDVTRALLDLAVERDEIAPVDTGALARMIAGLGRDFSRPEVMGQLASSPEQAADSMVDLVLAGLGRRA
ncbi:MAG: TetR/AcrR family transcriptional regulator [Actinomycetota bacterium]